MRTRRALSLVEVLMASFVALVCMVVVGATMPAAFIGRGKTDHMNRAMSLANKQMEAVRAVGYPNLNGTQLFSRGLIDSATPVAANTFSFTNVDNGLTDSPAQGLPGGTGTVMIEQVDIDLRRVTIRLNWNYRGQNRQVQLGTLIANL